jgi:anti-sigma factor RsiW
MSETPNLPESGSDLWRERLSAYVDDEIPPEEREAVEKAVASDSDRAAELRSLQDLSRALQAWKVEALEPPGDLAREIEAVRAGSGPGKAAETSFASLLEGGRRLPPPLLPRWATQAAVFCLGVLTGVAGIAAWRPEPPSGSHRRIGASPAEGTAPPPVVNVFITSSQAEGLLREVAAEEMGKDLMDSVRAGKGDRAIKIWQDLLRQYADTRAAKALAEDRAWGVLLSRHSNMGGI